MKLNHTGKRLTAGLLSCAMALSLCAPALAESAAALPAAEPGTSLLDETGDIPIDPAHFPDENFRDRVASYYDRNKDGSLSQAERNRVTAIYFSSCHITDLTGIELFPNLNTLDCSGNQLTSLDLSKNTELTHLNCHNNQLTSLDVSKNTALTYLRYSNNQLTSLDVSSNTALTWLECQNNQLTSLDVSSNTALTYLECQNNQLTSLDLSKSTALTRLFCLENQLTSLDVGKNTELTSLDCSENKLTSLDVSKNTELTSLDCSENQFTSLDVSQNSKLTTLVCENNQLTSLDLSKNTALTWLGCSGNKYPITVSESGQFDLSTLPDFDLSRAKWPDDVKVENGILTVPYNTTSLTYQYDVQGNGNSTDCWEFTLTFDEVKDPNDIPITADYFPDENFRDRVEFCFDKDGSGTLSQDERNNATELYVNQASIKDLTGIELFPNLETLDCKNNQLTRLDVSQNTKLTKLSCESNQLTSLDLSQNAALTQLDCSGNQLISLNLSQNTGLTRLICSKNQLTDLDLSKNSVLVYLFCSENQLTSLDVSQNSKLTTLVCENNQLTSLDLSSNTALTGLNCSGNQLASLDLSQNAYLIELDCSGNQLTSLDVSQNSKLTTLVCENNQLTSLDLSSNTALTGLDCSGNQLASLDLSKNTALTWLGCSGNKYPITVSESGQFDLSTLPDFDLSRAKWPDDVKVENGILTVPYNTTSLTYQYDTRQDGSTGTYQSFTLIFDEVKDPNDIPINDTSFPDKAFLDYVKQEIDTDGDGILSTAEQNAVTVIDVSGMGISDLTGIEHFPNLKSLKCYDNQLTKLDVSQNSELIELECYGNQLDELDVSENVMLAYLYCYNNRLTSLDLSKNAYLIELGCSGNQLTSLDLSQNTDLTRLICSKNQLTSLDLSKNTALSKLDCSDNKLPITVSGTGQFDLSTLPGFDASKANWPADAAVWENILTVPYGTTELSYEYDLGNGETGTFTLTFGEVEEPAPVTPEDPEHPMDPDFGLDTDDDSAGGALAAAAIGGAAVWGGYEITTRVILHSLLPDGAGIPSSRSQLALLIWTEKGKPEPAAQPAFADVTDPETAKAAQWCVEQGLLTAKKDGRFDPDVWTPKYRVIQVWNQAFPKQ